MVLSSQKDALKSDLVLCSVAAVLSFAVSASTVFLSLRVRILPPFSIMREPAARRPQGSGPEDGNEAPWGAEAGLPGVGMWPHQPWLSSCMLPLPAWSVWFARAMAHLGGSTVCMAEGTWRRGEVMPQPESCRWARDRRSTALIRKQT